MHPTLTYMAAQQHVEDLRRSAGRDRLARAATDNGRGSRISITRRSATAHGHWPEVMRAFSRLQLRH